MIHKTCDQTTINIKFLLGICAKMYLDNNKENYYPALRGLRFYAEKLKAKLNDKNVGNNPILGADIQSNIRSIEALIEDINKQLNIPMTIVNNRKMFCSALINYEEHLLQTEQELTRMFSGITPEIPNLKQEIKSIRDNLTNFCV